MKRKNTLLKIQVRRQQYTTSYLRKELRKARKEKGPNPKHKKCKQNDENEHLDLEFQTEKSFSCKEDGIFTEATRECVASLVALEVPTQNVGKVMKTVLAAAEVKTTAPPSRQAVVHIVDEAAFILSKCFAEKLEGASSWGLHKDGTSRQKRKILTSTLSLANGEEIPLGFKTVARETGERIQQSFREDLQELSAVKSFTLDDGRPTGETGDSNFTKTVLSSMTTVMSDRAANEKKANQLLKTWRDQVLSETSDEAEISTIHSFYCMAHVLLGFHSYTEKNFRALHQEYSNNGIVLGREVSSGAFARFKREYPAKRLVRLVSNSCGPVGDEKSGVREKWLAYCRHSGIKSLLQSYRDNRFNALFETAAQVHLHKQDLLTFFGLLDEKNLMLQSVYQDLSDPRIRSMVHAIAVV